MRKPKKPNGVVFYRGPSMLDGAPIVAIATGLAKRSRNTKTGHMVQTWILREDITPVAAVHSGQDASVCGGCALRGVIVNGRNKKRRCYVKVFRAPTVVWKALKRGVYRDATPEEAATLIAGMVLRLGSYGDPAAIPTNVWRPMVAAASAHNGYTHQWRTCDPKLSSIVMASADNANDRTEANAKGFRTFRVRLIGEPMLPREVVCPASKEAGAKTQCVLCRACGGTSAKAKADIVILDHGPQRSMQIAA